MIPAQIKVPGYRVIKWACETRCFAKDELTDIDVVIKFYPKVFKLKHEQVGFENTLALHHRMNHPFILKLYDKVELENFIALVYEYAAKGTLQDKLGHGPIPQKEAKKIYIQLISVIRYLHQDIGISHLYLNPSSILFDENGNVKLTKFIYHQNIGGSEDMYVNSRNNPFYNSPEISSGKPFNYKSDIWSLGVLFFYIQFHELPFYDPSISILLEMITTMQPIYQHCNSDFHQLLKDMLDKNPEERLDIEAVISSPFFSNCKFVDPINITLHDQIGKQILRKMNQIGANTQSIHADLLSQSYTRTSAIYYELLRVHENELVATLFNSEEFSTMTNSKDKNNFKRIPNVHMPFSISAKKLMPLKSAILLRM